MSATAKTLSTNCAVTDGMFVQSFTTLRLDSIATAFGQCQTMLPDCTVPGCACVPGPAYERLIAGTRVWADITSQYLNGSYTLGNVFGVNPDGGTGFFHILDSTQPNSTGPVSFLVASAGDYLVHFNANINTTICNMLPAQTPQVDIMVHVRTSLHRGERTNGSLIGGVRLPAGIGYYHFWGTDTILNPDDWGGAESTNQFIQVVGNQWSINHPAPRIGIGDMSRQTGGLFWPHSEHQNGLDVDVRYVGKNGYEGPLDLAITYDLVNVYDRALTIELLNLFVANASLTRIIVDPNAGISSGDVPGATIVVDSTGKHHHHLHISLTDPDGTDTNNCP